MGAHSSLALTPHLPFEKQRPSHRGTGSGASFAFGAPVTRPSPGPPGLWEAEEQRPFPEGGCEGPEMLAAGNRHVSVAANSTLMSLSLLFAWCLPRARNWESQLLLGVG